MKLSRREADSKARRAVSGNVANIVYSMDEMDSTKLIFAHLKRDSCKLQAQSCKQFEFSPGGYSDE
ncbi:hypothetical protein DBR45_46345 [Pseudomonas sp. HMWF031]|nr:hypothetical protein DBR45_46345 [Pseudomonas sp. HMWF031]